MYLLTFDTSLNKTYITLSRDEKILVSEIIGSENGIYHSEFLISAVDKILEHNLLEMKDINAVATNIGPGSFTGIRTCNTVARVMGQQLGIDVIGVCSLEIISLLNETQKKTLCLMDARKNKAYAAVYFQGGTLINPCAMEIDQVFELVSRDDFQIIADGKMSILLKENNIDSINFEACECDLGINLAKLAYKYLKAGGDFNFAKLKPLYIQPPSISMPKSGKV